MHLRRVVAIALALAAAGLSALAQAPPTRAAHTVPVTVSIISVDGVGDDLDGIGRGDGDFYAGAAFSGGSRLAGNSFSTHVDDDPNITPFWTIPSNVTVGDDSVPATSIELSIWDHDDCGSPFCTDTGVFESNDDQLDIKPGDGETVTLTVNLNNGRWTGPVNWPTNCVTGDGGEAVKVCFDIGIDSLNGDADGDFMLDGWERNGFNADGDGTVDVDLPAMGANPGRKDLFLELDCLVAPPPGHSHCPVQGAVQTVVQSFADAPVNNIDGTTGIQLHVDIGNLYNQAAGAATNVLRTGAAAGGVTGTIGNYGGGGSQIAEAGNLVVDWDGAAGSPATNFFTLKGANFSSLRDYIFRYGIFVHQTNARRAANDCTSGWAKGIPGVNFLVSLGGTRANGNPCWGVDGAGNSVGTQNQQAGTLMHEFGHTIGLGHGGSDGFNNKPNYLSVMNYGISTGPAATPNSVQFCGVPAVGGLPGGCDYSRIDLADLNEVNPPGLDECAGIGLGLGGVDWNGAGGLTGGTCAPASGNVQADVNGDFNDANNNNTQDPGEATTFSNLPGFEDWNNLFYGFRTIPNFQSAGTPVADEPDPDSIAESRAFLSGLLQPTLSVDKTGPSDARPGDALDYAIKVSNTGRGPALATAITDTKPDNSQASFDIGTLPVGGEATRNVPFTVPCSAADGTVLTNKADATAKDLISNPVSGSDSVQTTIHTPVVTLGTTATPSVLAGESITYRITYENTGSGEATNAVITATLPADVYYSKALDTGAGPRPDTVTVNGDGSRTLTWNVGTVAGASGAKTIEFTARPTLLALVGTSFTEDVKLSFTNANGCSFASPTASASTTISVVPPTKDPHTLGYWRNHPESWTDEIRARIHATDQRYDGIDGSAPDGALSAAEVSTMYLPGGNQPKVLQMQLLSTYFNLATRRINADTGIDSPRAAALGTTQIRAAAIYAMNTLSLPVNSSTRGRYSDINAVLDDVNNNRTLVF
jgi:uncharacterized repeat protein (TIGR01451 family)